MSAIYVALVHHPVRGATGETLTTSITNLDVHDVARSARTYGARAAFVVTPVHAQQEIVRSIVEHWLEGPGRTRIPARGEALRLARVVPSVDAAIGAVEREHGVRPRVLATAARGLPSARRTTFDAERAQLGALDAPAVLLLFGTGHGLADGLIAAADAVLPPLREGASFNHLSVRAAVAVVLDRLVGDRPEVAYPPSGRP